MRVKARWFAAKVFVNFFLGLKGQQGPFFAKQESREKQNLCMEILQSLLALILQKLAERAWVLTDTSALPGVLEGPSYSIYKPLLSRQRNLQPSWETGLNPCRAIKELSLFYSQGRTEEIVIKLVAWGWGGVRINIIFCACLCQILS